MEEHPYKGTIKFNMHVRGSSHVRAYYTLESILLHKKTKKQKKNSSVHRFVCNQWLKLISPAIVLVIHLPLPSAWSCSSYTIQD